MPSARDLVRRTAASVVAAATVALLLAPISSAAAPHKFHTPVPQYVFASIHLPASNGYRFELSGDRVHYSEAELAKFTDPAPASITNLFVKLTRGPATATYGTLKATIGGGLIQAQFGRLGEVSLRFAPRHVTRRRPQKGCTGPGLRIEHGVFVGMLRFRGEGGYTRLLRRRIPGTLSRQSAQACDLVPKAARQTRGTRVGGDRFKGQKGVGFTAKRLSPVGAATLTAYDSEQRGRVSVQRTVEAKGPAGSVLIADGLTEATVKPPAPFQGEARFKAFEGKQSGTWLGSLSVSFPGAPDVRLAGKAFEGSLLTGNQCSVDPRVTCVSF